MAEILFPSLFLHQTLSNWKMEAESDLSLGGAPVMVLPLEDTQSVLTTTPHSGLVQQRWLQLL